MKFNFLNTAALFATLASAAVTTQTFADVIQMDDDYAVYTFDGANTPIVAAVIEHVLKQSMPRNGYQAAKIDRVGKSVIDIPTLSLYSVDLIVSGYFQKCEIPASQASVTGLQEVLSLTAAEINSAKLPSLSAIKKEYARVQTENDELTAQYKACAVSLNKDSVSCSVRVSTDTLTESFETKQYHIDMDLESCPALAEVGKDRVSVDFRKVSPLEIEVIGN